MNRAIISLVAAALLLLAAAPAHAEPLSEQRAQAFSDAALKDAMGNNWPHEDWAVDCWRLSRSSFRCLSSWTVGDAAFRARLRARLVNGKRAVVGSVRMVDEYCLNVSRAGNCVTTTQVDWRR